MSLFIVIFRAALFYLIPILCGYLVSLGLSSITKRKKVTNLFASVGERLTGETDISGAISLLRIPWYFCLGVLLLLALAVGTSALTVLMPTLEFAQVYFPITYLLFFAGGITLCFKTIWKPLGQVQVKEILPVLTMLALCSIVIAIWNWKTPYSLNWDLYEHQTVSRLVQQGSFDFQTTNISDTFGFSSYPPTFHLLLASSQSLVEESPQDILLYWQWLGYFHLVTVSIASYYIGLAISKNRTVALLSGIIGTTTFESVIAFTSLFILPQTVTATLFATAWAGLVLTAQKTSTKISLTQIIVMGLSLVLLHYIIGTLAAALLIGTYLALYWKPLISFINTHYFMVIYSGILLSGIALSYIIDFSWINSGEAAAYLFSLSEKLKYTSVVYGFSLVIFSGAGIWALFTQKHKNHKLFIIILLGFSALLVSNIPYVIKFYTLGRYFFHVLMALGAYAIIKEIGWGRKLWLSLIALLFILILILNAASWKQHVLFKNLYSHISADDLAAAHFLQTYVAENGSNQLLISDPTTMYLLEGLSGINTPGGVFATPETRQLLYKALSSDSIFEIKGIASQINDPLASKDSSTILVISGRTFKWFISPESQRNAFEFNIWSPIQLSYGDQLEIEYFTSSGADVVYSNPSYVIIRM